MHKSNMKHFIMFVDDITPLAISVGGSLLSNYHLFLSDIAITFSVIYTAAKFYNDFFKSKKDERDKENN